MKCASLAGKSLESGIGQKVEPILKLLQFIGTLNGGRSVSQVALNYLVAKGVSLHPH